MVSCRLTQRMLDDELKVEIWERDDGSVHFRHPNIRDDELDAFLFNLRLFQQENDGISLRAMSKVVLGLTIDASLKDEFEAARAEVNRFLDSPFLPKDLAGVTTRAFIDAMLYGLYAHTNVRQFESVEQWQKHLGRDPLQTCFVAVLENYLLLLASFFPVVQKIRRAVEP